MVYVSEILRKLDLGNSVAETDENLQEYFVETQPYRDLMADRRDVIAGDKGTGKTAIYKVLQKNYSDHPGLTNVEVIPAFNPAGNPVFKALTEREATSELEYTKLWKAYVLSVVGNWVIRKYGAGHNDQTRNLEALLEGLDIRVTSDLTRTIFQKIMSGIGSLFQWKKAELELTTNPATGTFSVIPRVETVEEPQARVRPIDIPVEDALSILEDALASVNMTVWVALDRLDEAFQGVPEVEIPALRALLRTYLDMREFRRVKLKLFIRRDLLRRIVDDGQFVNLTHINASKTDIVWSEDDLLGLLLRRVKRNPQMLDLIGRTNESLDIFDVIFPHKVDPGDRKPRTWIWMMRRVRDGNNVKPPRNLIDLVTLARDEQLKREDREPRVWVEGMPLLEPEALKTALAQLSDNRVQDTLLAEAGTYAALIRAFEGSRSEHNDESLSQVLRTSTDEVRLKVKPLIELGFLEVIRATGTYKIPTLYRTGLSITQGKAFGGSSNVTDEED